MAVTDLLDWALDKTVVPGYTRIGPKVRGSWWPSDPPPGALAGSRVLVTGATSGIGAATAAGLARLGATVHLVGRDASRTDAAARAIADDAPDADLNVEVCDVSDLASVRRFAADFGSRVDRLHGLIHNAGVMASERTETPEGHELNLATHVLGPFLLTRELTDLLTTDGDARVVFTSSGGMYAESLHPTDFEYRHESYSATTAYARTKRMQVVVAELLAERLKSEGVTVHSMHPGWVNTPGVRTHLPRFHTIMRPLLRDDAAGADTMIWLSAAAEASSSTGLFWHDRRPRPTSFGFRAADSGEDRQALWDFCTVATASA